MRLTELERQVVRLALLEGLTNEEIAERLDTTYAAVACTLGRASRRLGSRTVRQGYYKLAALAKEHDKQPALT